ncbi:MAG TPA: CotH kinase family protein [Glycomyces sp.]|nr:CotH kinase family protein [Glycomyces sp.]
MRWIRRALAAAGASLAITVGLTGVPAAAQTAPEAPQPAQTSPVWDASTVHDIQVTVDETEYAAMIEEYLDSGDKEWITADVTIDGRLFPGAGMKLKGNSSLWGVNPGSSPTDLPWLIRLDKYVQQDFDGYERFVVRSSFTPSALNEALALRLLEEAGLTATKFFPTSFSANGEPAQLRLIVQEPDKQFDRENHGEDGGTLYKKKFEGDFAYLGEDAESYEEAWEPKGGDEDNWQPLLDYLDWLNNSTDAEFAAELTERMDAEAFARYLAFEDLIGNWDTIDGPGQNGYLRFTPATGRMTVVAWDHNLSFAILPDPGDPPPNAPKSWGCPCVERAMEVPAFQQLYDQQAALLQAELFDSGLALSALEELAAPLVASGLIDPAAVAQDQAQIRSAFPEGGPTEPVDPPVDEGCTASYTVANDWGSGFTASVEVVMGQGSGAWEVSWVWPGDQRITNAWSSTVTQSGTAVAATGAAWNATLTSGQSTTFGFNADYSGANALPTLTCTAA